MNSKKSEFKDAWVEAMKEPKNEAIAEFLRQLPEEEIHGLVKTTSGGVISAENVEEAITVIIMFSDAVSLLNRRRVKKDYLMAYLASKKVKFSFQSDKSRLCNLVLRLWGEAEDKKLKFDNEEKPKPKVSSEASSQTRIPTAASVKLEPIPVQTQTTPEKPKTKFDRQTSSFIVNSVNSCQVINTVQQPSALHPTYEATTEDAEMSEDDDDAASSSTGSPIKKSTEAERETGQMLAVQFAEWFYTRLNTLQDFTSAHFWKDCNFSMQIESIVNPRTLNVVRDGDTVCLVMRSLVAEEGCFFNPNILNGLGVRGKVNPHGLAQVMICGTVHRGNAGVGTFEQTFGLMKDPTMANSFKIKFSLLRLRERSALMNGSQEDSHGPESTMCGIIEEIDD